MTDPVTEARERLERLLPDVLRYDPVSMPAFDQRIDALIEAVRAEAGVSMTLPGSDELARTFHEQYERLAPSFGYVTRRDSSVPWEDVPAPNRSLMLAVATEVLERWPALAARSAGSGSRVEAEVATDLKWSVARTLSDLVSKRLPEHRGGDLIAPSDVELALLGVHHRMPTSAPPTPPPSVDGTRCAVCGEVKDDVFHEPCLIGGRFHNVKTCHPFTPPTPAPADRLRALEAALERIEDLLRLREDGSTPTGETMVMAWNVAARALLADGERSE